jgi:hypothetical protein
MKNVTNLVGTMLMLIALYLVLRFGANAGKVIGAISTGAARVFKTLQARA